MNDDRTPDLPEQINKPRLYLAATGHVFMGLCPDHTQPESRDPKCPACRLLAAAALSAAPAQEPAEEHPAEETLRSLACWLGVGGYNAPTVDAKLYEQKIREGVTVYSQLHGFAARALAETVLHMDLITPKGIRARELARQVLGIVPPFASPLPQEVKALQPLTEEQCNQIADCAFAFFDVPPCERDEGLARYIIQLTTEALSAERELRGAQEGKAGEDEAEFTIESQDGVCLAAATGQRAEAWAEIQHYAAQYAEEGPLTIYEVTRKPVATLSASSKGEQR